MINRIVLVGRLVADPEERHSNEGTVICKFRIAVDRIRRNRDGEREADFFNCVCFGRTAEFCNRNLQRGELVAVEGRVEIDDYTDRDGQRQRWVSVVCDNVQKLTWNRDGDGGGGGGGRDRQDRGDRDRPREGARDSQPRRSTEDDFGGDEPPADRAASGGGRRQQFDRPPAAAAGPTNFDEDEDDPFAEE